MSGKGGKRGVRGAIEAAEPVQKAAPSAGGAPAYLAARFSIRADGLHRNNDDPTQSFWVCGPFAIEAELRDNEGGGWGLLLSWQDRDGKRHEESFGRSLFTGECAELRGRLADGGLSMNGTHAGRQALAEYLNIVSCTHRARSVTQVGWHQIGGRPVFVLPDVTFGDPGERVVLQAEAREPSLFNTSGTVAQWRDSIGLLCCGNSRLIFGASCGFAAPVLGMLGEDGGGFNLLGKSQSGKSTVLRVAASVCGGTPDKGARGFIRSWRATGNGLEAVASAHNDTLLLLDEMGEVDGRVVGEIAYMLSNGQGKARAGRSGLARPAMRWKVLLLSSTEVSLAGKMAEAGGSDPKAGQEVRLPDVPSDAGVGLGAFEELHEAESPDAFVRDLREFSQQFYGAPLHAFLAMLADRRRRDPVGFPDAVRDRIRKSLQTWLIDLPDAGGQVRSVGFRFALVGVAGEMASDAGLTGWPSGAASEAAKTCFLAWLSERGTLGAREDAQAVSLLRSFILANGSARFDIWADAPLPDAAQVEPDPCPPAERFRTQKRAGWRRWEVCEGGRVAWCYYLTGDGMKEALAGLAFREARKTLVKLNYLMPSKNATDVKNGVLAASYSVPGHSKTRLYQINPSILATTEGSD